MGVVRRGDTSEQRLGMRRLAFELDTCDDCHRDFVLTQVEVMLKSLTA